ncbi:hypothetical protein [Sulfitobacter aestuariivivens]|uniref:Uncharacterized protein n=1 Tax=Sulfitobacter aestuariivivens TaxID=2766981 RepID=A0A927D3G9_9RHOB|nr:hypothetical protein [Sulfitobacter aestuariivivens]MBD3664294.1 hypothetical protein [Sulfitobacter aestuariivivens]
MTALSKYDRLESVALWRATADGQRREVVVSIGDATLVIKDITDRALTHWSLAAVERANPGNRPAVYFPDGDPGETLEFPEDETEMVDAIETLRRAINRARPKPGRLRGLGLATSLAVVAAVAVFWLPGAMRDHTLTVVPNVKRAEIGSALLSRIERVSGQPCRNSGGLKALARLSDRLGVGTLVVLSDMTRPSLHLPGGIIALNRSLIEDFEEPDVAAGYALTEAALRDAKDPLRDLIEVTGLRENFRLLTTGELAPFALDGYAEHLMTRAAKTPALPPQLAQFERASLRSTPYAYALDITGETTLPLIEGDPMNGRLTEPLLSDADWLRLQGICGG